MISILKKTFNYLGYKQNGVFKSDVLEANYSKQIIEGNASEMTAAARSNYFTDVRLFYGDVDAVEYYPNLRSSIDKFYPSVYFSDAAV